MKKIDWNQASELGLVERINAEVLHPLGLAMARNLDDGTSPCVLVADDRVFEYDNGYTRKPVITKDELHSQINDMLDNSNVSEFQFETNKDLVKAVSERLKVKNAVSATIGGGFNETSKVTIEVLLTQEDLQAIINDMAKGE